MLLIWCTIVKHVGTRLCFPSKAQKCEPSRITTNYNKSWNKDLFSNRDVIVGNAP